MFLTEQNKEMLNQPVVGSSAPARLFHSHEAVFCFKSSVTTVREQPWVPCLCLGTNLAQGAQSLLDGQLCVHSHDGSWPALVPSLVKGDSPVAGLHCYRQKTNLRVSLRGFHLFFPSKENLRYGTTALQHHP